MPEIYRKVADSSLAAVAQAILAKGGTSTPLTFPQGFIAAIGAIETATPTQTLQVTPGDAQQIFDPPSGYHFGRVTVDAIPSNYGKISFNGASLKVE